MVCQKLGRLECGVGVDLVVMKLEGAVGAEELGGLGSTFELVGVLIFEVRYFA